MVVSDQHGFIVLVGRYADLFYLSRAVERAIPLCSKVFNGLFYLSAGVPRQAFVPFKALS